MIFAAVVHVSDAEGAAPLPSHEDTTVQGFEANPFNRFLIVHKM
jgi:hypothetical protein